MKKAGLFIATLTLIVGIILSSTIITRTKELSKYDLPDPLGNKKIMVKYDLPDPMGVIKHIS